MPVVYGLAAVSRQVVHLLLAILHVLRGLIRSLCVLSGAMKGSPIAGASIESTACDERGGFGLKPQISMVSNEV